MQQGQASVQKVTTGKEDYKQLDIATLIGMLDDKSFEVRQAVKNSILEKRDDDQILCDPVLNALRSAYPSASKQTQIAIAQILEKEEFKIPELIFRAVKDKESLDLLQDFAKQLCDQRIGSGKINPSLELHIELVSLSGLALTYGDLGVADLIEKMENGIGANGKYDLSGSNTFHEIKENILTMASDLSQINSPNLNRLFLSLNDIPWQEHSLASAKHLVERVSCAFLSENAESDADLLLSRNEDVGIEAFICKASTGISQLNFELKSGFERYGREELADIYLKAVKTFNRVTNGQSVDLGGFPSLEDLSRFIMLNQEIIERTYPTTNNNFDPDKSKVLKPLIDSWIEASQEKDLTKLKDLLDAHKDLELLSEIGDPRNVIELGGGKVVTHVSKKLDHIVADNILCNEEIPLNSKVDWLKVVRSVRSNLEHWLNKPEPIYAKLKSFLKSEIDGFEENLDKKDYEKCVSLERKLLAFRKCIEVIESLSLYEEEKGSKQLIEAFNSYLGFDHKQGKEMLMTFLDKGGDQSKLESLFNKFGSPEIPTVRDLGRVFDRLQFIQAHNPTTIEDRLCGEAYKSIISALKSEDPEALKIAMKSSLKLIEAIKK